MKTLHTIYSTFAKHNMAKFLTVLTILFTVGVGSVLGADKTVTWTASSGALGSGIGSGTIKTGTYSWDYTRTLVSGTTYTGWTSNCIQLGKNGGVENITFTTSAIPGKIKSVSVECSSYNNAHKVSIKVGNTTYLSSTATPKWTTVSAKTGTGTSSGQIVISFTDGSRALYIKSISVTYEEAATCTTAPTVSAASNSNITSTTATVSCSGITSLGSAGCSITSYGFVYGTTANPTISSNTKVQLGTTYTTTSTAFSKELTGLTANTTYYVRPYATNGYGTAYGTQTSFKTLELPKYTVTLVPGSGSVTSTTLTESSSGAGVTLPTPTLNGCDEWTFAGWKTTSAVATETSTKPTLIAAGTYKPASNITLYAVYQRTEETEGTPTTTSKTYTHTITAKTWSANGAQTLNNVSWTLTNDGNYYGYDGTKGQQVGSGSSPAKSMTLTTSGFSSATKITAVRISTSGASSVAAKVSVKVGSTSYTCNSSTNPVAISTTNTQYTFTGNSTGDITISWTQTSSKALYFKTIEVDYQTSTAGGTITTIYYHSTPDCTTETVVTLNPNGGTGSAITENISESTYTVPNCTFIRAGYSFSHWDTKADDSGVDYNPGGNINLNGTAVNLYAIWTPIKYTITYNLDGGTNHASNPANYTIETATISLQNPSKTGHNFGGWYKESTFATQVTQIAQGSTGNITLYAQWTAKSLVNYRTDCDVVIKCDAYSFHTGDGTIAIMEKEENIICFEEHGVAQSGLEHEWQINNYTIPADEKFFVGYYGYFYNDNLGIGDTDGDKSRSVVSDWTNMYLAPSMTSDDPEHSPRLGHAKGAVGTLRIFDDSDWDNLFVGFIPDGYTVKFGETEYPLTMANADNHEYRTELLQYEPNNYANAVSVGVIDENGNYVATANTQKMRHIFLKVNSDWASNNAKFSIYDIGAGAFKNGFMTHVPGSTDLYEGWVDKDCDKIIFVRHNADATSPSWENKWNQTGNLSLQANQNMFTIAAWDDQTDAGWANGTYTKYGKFRMYEDSKAINWYVNFYPYHALTYDKNAEDATGTMDMQFIEADAENKNVVVANCGFTRPGYEFKNWRKDNTNTYYAPNGSNSIELSADITLYAQWTAKKIKITWDANGGSVDPTTSTYTYNGTPVELPTPTRANYIFKGWFTATSGGTQIADVGTTNKPTDDVTYYAQWTEKTTPTFAWSDATCTAALEADNTFPTLSNPDNLSVTYKSSDENVAKIDVNGNVILGTVGETEITATGAETVTHKSATTTYKLIVVASNCKWVEVTDNATLEDGDEVVISMTLSTGISYALPNDEATNTVPDAIKITNTTSFANDYIWIIGKNGNNLTFESYKNSGKFLTCNNADAGVRVNTGTNKTFIIDDTYGYLKNIANNRYLGVHSENIAWYSYALTNTGNFPQKIAGQTLKFYKRECLDATNYWVEGNLTNVTCDPQLPQQLAKDGSIILTFTAADGYALPNDVTVTNATKTWNKTTGTLTISNPTGNVMVTVSAVELHTITWMVGNNPVLTEKVANTTGVTQTPASNPEGDAIGDCADTFLGWSEKSAGSTPQDVAYYDDLCTAAAMKEKHTSVTGDKIFYAVFATAITTPGTSITKEETYSHTITSRIWDATGAKMLNNVSWTLANNGGYYGYDGTKGQQVGSGSKPAKSMTLTTSGFTSASKITSVTINTSGASGTNAKVSVKVGGTSYSCNANTTPAISTTVTDYKFTGNSTGEIVISWSQTSSKAIYFKSITVVYSNTTTTPDVTTYSNYVTNCCALAPATNLTVSGTTSNTATLTWTAPSPATGITKLQVRNAADDAVVVDNIAVGTTTATITGLTECTKYNYYVASVGDCEVFSNIVTAQPFSNAKTVNYDYNGGSGSPASFTTSCENQVITLPTATRAGYDFNGWYTAATGGTKVGDAGGTYNPTTSSITLYAQWTKKIYIISFHANLGEGTMANQSADENDVVAQLNANQFTRDGYAFVGWNTKANGTGIAYADQATDITLTGNLTLYAQWAPIVTLNDAGNEESAHPTAVNGTITLPDGANACDPYEFVGWTSVATADWNEGIEEPALVASPYKPTAPITLYAVYKIQDEGNPNAFKLSFEGGNGKTYYVGEYGSSPYLRGFSNITKEEAVTFIRTKMYPNDDTKYYIYLEHEAGYYYYNSSYGLSTTSSEPEENQGWVFHTVGDKIQIQAIGQERYLSYVEPGSTDERTNITTHATGSQKSFNMLPAVTSTYVASPLCNQEIEIIFETGNGDFVDNAPATNPLTVSRGDVITLPTCEYPGYEFMGWLKDEQQPEPSDIPVTYYTGDYTVSGNSSSITFYAYYKAVPEEVEFTGKDDAELLMYYYDGTANYYYAVSHAAERGELSSKQNCFNATTWTFTNVGNMQYHIQDETGKYLGAYSDRDNDLILSVTPKVWTFTEVNGLWKMVCENSPSRALMYNSEGKFFTNAAISNEGNGAYSYVALGICPSPTYTTNPVLTQGFSITNTAMVTSASGQKVKAASALTLETRNIELPCKFTITAPNITFYDNTGAEVTELESSAASEQFELHFAYKPTAENTMEYPTVTITDDEHKTYTIKNRIYARSLPDTFAIVAKVGNLWYALPSQGLNSTTPPAAYPVEVDDMADPTAVTAVPANADWSLRGVYEASRSDATKDRYVANGDNLVFVNNASPAMTLNASTSGNYLLTDAQYANYYQTNPGLYEWTPTTTDLETYQLTNEQRSITLSVNTATVFGVHATDKAVEQVRFLPIQDRYKPAALQVVEWKENSVVIMYNGDPVQTASVSVNGAAAQNTTLSAAQRDIAVYELAANGLAANPTQRLSITIGTEEKVILSIPYIISGAQTDLALLPGSTVAARQEVAKVSDLVVLNGATLTAAGAKSNPYKFRNVTIYGGGKLVIPSDKGFGVSSLTMRVGAVESGNYKALYPQLVLNGNINTGNINIDYLTTYDRYYALSLPYQADTRDILYPAEIYGDNLKTGNTASFALQWYDGEARASETRKGWKDLEEPAILEQYKGYTFWGAPRKVSVNGESKRQNFGIHRIPIKPTANELITGETSGRQITVYAHPAANAYDAGWNFIGNPYLAQYGNMEDGHTSGLLSMLTQNPETGVWEHIGDYRYITLTDDGKTYWQTPVSEAELYPFNTFFVQAGDENGAVSFNASNRASLPARHYAAQQESAKEITTGIILTGNDQTDRTGLLIADNFTEEYDFNADLSKFENSGINLYTIGKDGKLAYMAINQALAEQPIPVGYSAPAEGLYTIAFDEDRYNATDISALYLIDYDSNEKTNLLHTDYSFVTATGTNNQRFALQVAFAPENATNVEWVGDATIQVGVEGNELILNNLPTDAAVHVFDALGRLMYHTPHAPTEMQLTLPTGYYLVRIADKQNAVVTNIVIP